MVAGYSNAYADVGFDDYIRASAQTVVRSVVGRCLSEPATLPSLPAVLTGELIFSRHLTAGPLGARLAQNVLPRATRIPTLIAQGEADSLVLPRVQHAFAQAPGNSAPKRKRSVTEGAGFRPIHRRRTSDVEPDSPIS